MWTCAIVTAWSRPFRDRKGESANRNLPLITATRQVAKVAAMQAQIPELREEAQAWYLDLGSA